MFLRAMTFLRFLIMTSKVQNSVSVMSVHLKFVHHMCQSTEEMFSFAEDGQKTASVTFNHTCEDGLLACLAHSLELVGDADESLHLTVILRSDLLECRTELQPTLPEETR